VAQPPASDLLLWSVLSLGYILLGGCLMVKRGQPNAYGQVFKTHDAQKILYDVFKGVSEAVVPQDQNISSLVVLHTLSSGSSLKSQTISSSTRVVVCLCLAFLFKSARLAFRDRHMVSVLKEFFTIPPLDVGDDGMFLFFVGWVPYALVVLCEAWGLCCLVCVCVLLLSCFVG
jgi:hypothetical protein